MEEWPASSRVRSRLVLEIAVRTVLVVAGYVLAFLWVEVTMRHPSTALALWHGTALAILCIIARPRQIPLIATVTIGSIIGGIAGGCFHGSVPSNGSEGMGVFLRYLCPVIIGGLLAGVLYRCVLWRASVADVIVLVVVGGVCTVRAFIPFSQYSNPDMLLFGATTAWIGAWRLNRSLKSNARWR